MTPIHARDGRRDPGRTPGAGPGRSLQLLLAFLSLLLQCDRSRSSVIAPQPATKPPPRAIPGCLQETAHAVQHPRGAEPALASHHALDPSENLVGAHRPV